MTFVVDKSGNTPTDNRLTSANRTNAGTPNGVLTPLFAGEFVYDSVNQAYWRAQTMANNTWVNSIIEI